MNITHICLACFYIEGMGYQENVLPKMHKQLGHDVTIITSRYAFDTKGMQYSRDVGNYINKDGIKVHIIDYAKVNKYVSCAIVHSSYFNLLLEIKPDMIFVHGPQFWRNADIIKYKYRYPKTKIVIDSHADYINAPIDTIKKLIHQKYITRIPVRVLAKYACKIWGVTPLRVKYLMDVYGLPASKVGLLVMGGDDDKIHIEKLAEIRELYRSKIGVGADEFLVVTGGKIDRRKNIHLLMKAISQMDNVKLVVFGVANSEISETINDLSQNHNIRYIGWIDSDDAYNWFLSSDLAVFPGTHSVLWEQAIACGIPGVFKRWDGMEHVDAGGNCKFLQQDSVEEIIEVLNSLIQNQTIYDHMKQVAVDKGIKAFSYREIAIRSIDV